MTLGYQFNCIDADLEDKSILGMDATRVHLFITHLPVFGIFLGFMALLFGLIRKDRQVKIVSLLILLIAISGGIIAFQTGESAEETVENLTGISENTIEEHEESAELTILFFYALGILTLISLSLELKNNKYARQVLFLVMALSILTFFLVVRTAALGGKIRHTEISV